MKILLVVIMLFLAGCSSIITKEPVLPLVGNPDVHEIDSGAGVKKKYYMSCDIEHYPQNDFLEGPDKSTFGLLEVSTAKKSYLYGLMSVNAYRDDLADVFYEIPNWKLKSRYQSKSGFSADLYVSSLDDKRAVVAFRGTDFFTRDWWSGNLVISLSGKPTGQYEEAGKLIKTIKNDLNGYDITVAGHSLGGGLALHISLNDNAINAIVFNTSLRVFQKNWNEEALDIASVWESGEMLQKIRNKCPTVNMLESRGADFISYNFIESKNFTENLYYTFVEHSSVELSRGLLLIAASYGDENAKEIMKLNLGCDIGG